MIEIEVERKLIEARTEFLNSPYAGQWDQVVSVKLTADELRLLAAHLQLNPMNVPNLRGRLGNFGTLDGARLARGG